MNKRRIVFLFILLVGTILFFTPYSFLSLFIWIGAIFLILNKIVIKKANKHCSSFSSQREIKRYDSMVIGECVKPFVYEDYCDKSTTLVFTSPDRTLDASFQILLHMTSFISEGGTCIITHNPQNKSRNDYSLFDLPYLHYITKKELNIEYLNDRLRFPLIYEPIKSLKILLSVTSSRFRKDECPNQEIVDFCKRKGISLIYLRKC